jgi:histidinol dehydrogenase
MARRLNNTDPAFEDGFKALLADKREQAADVDDAVAAIIARVRDEGDTALAELTLRYDRLDLAKVGMRVTGAEIAAARAKVDKTTLDALELAHDRILDHHKRQLPQDDVYKDRQGVELGTRWTPVQSVGLYVPGGTASYPSSVLMNAVPARVAGVDRIVMVTPASKGAVNPLTLVAAKLAGITEIYRVGGAQAVAALAYGTDTIKPVDKIVGPGNAYVAAAKREVFGRVGIDSIAGPSEILVVADGANDPAWIAADLLSQAEHDASSQSILNTDSAALADAVAKEVERQLALLPRREIAGASWRQHGAIITVPDLKAAAPLVDAIAPEHLEIATDDPAAFFARVRNAGAAFLGRYTPEAIGDYLAGPNHVLPTSRTARFSSGLSVLDFVKRTSIVSCDAEALGALGDAALALAEAEGLAAHGRSIGIRLNRGAG